MRNPARAGQPLVRSYVVRIYREDGEELAGVVEDVQSGRSMRFRSVEELHNALHAHSPMPTRPAGVTKTAR